VKRLALWGYQVDVAFHRAWRRGRSERPWTLEGGCRRSGACCEAPGLAVGRLTWSMPNVRRLFLAWQRRVNGFELVSADARARVFVFRCTHYDRKTRSCDSYDSRPGVCRDYPRNLMWQPAPELLPPCGYRARPPNAEALRASLEALDLTPAQREKLRRGLRLDG
jgi:Fe-S-cluster containining protein